MERPSGICQLLYDFQAVNDTTWEIRRVIHIYEFGGDLGSRRSSACPLLDLRPFLKSVTSELNVRIKSCPNCTLIFKCPFSPGRNVVWIDQAAKLRQVASPPLVHAHCSDATEGFRLVTPSTPVAIKGVHAAGHIYSRFNKCCSGQPIFGLKIDDGGLTPDQARS